MQEGSGCPAAPWKIPRITGILLLSPTLSLTPASSRFPPSVEREYLLLQHSTTAGSLTIIPHPQHLPRAPGAQSLQFPVGLKPQPLPSLLEHSFHEWAAKAPEPAGRAPEPLAAPGLGLQEGSGRCPGERFSQQAPFCFHLE